MDIVVDLRAVGFQSNCFKTNMVWFHQRSVLSAL